MEISGPTKVALYDLFCYQMTAAKTPDVWEYQMRTVAIWKMVLERLPPEMYVEVLNCIDHESPCDTLLEVIERAHNDIFGECG